MLVAGLVLIALTGIFPPWIAMLQVGTTPRPWPLGHALVTSPPSGGQIDLRSLLVEWVVIVALTLATALAASKFTSRDISAGTK